MTVSASWIDEAIGEAQEEAQRLLDADRAFSEFAKYQDNPTGFTEDVFNDILTEDMRLVMESVKDNRVTIAKSGNALGKTYVAARIALWFFVCFESKVFLTAAPPLQNLKRLLWGEVLAGVYDKKGLFESFKKRSLYIQRHPQSFIQCLTIPQTGTEKQRESKFSGKHGEHMLFIVDEGDAVPDAVYRGIESCMSGDHNRLLVMFNPRQKAGKIYRLEKNKRAQVIRMSAFSHPNVITGKGIIPGAVDRSITVRRIQEWTRPIKDNEDPEAADVFEVPEFLVGAQAEADDGRMYQPLLSGRRKIINPAFSYMVLGLYPAQGQSQLINEEWIERAVQRWKLYVAEHGEVQNTQPKMGLDVGEKGNDPNVAVFRYGGFVERIIHEWNGIDTDETATKALRLYRKKNVDIAYIDGTSWGSSVAPSMARQGREYDVRAVGVKITTSPEDFISTEMGEFYQLRDQLYWAVREWLKNDTTAMLPDDPELLEELRALDYTVDQKGRIRVSDKESLQKILRRSPNKLDALSLTFSPYERAKVVSLEAR